jgi:hypothetical protein
VEFVVLHEARHPPPSGEAASYVNGKRPGIFHSEKFILAPSPLVLLAIGRQSHGIAKMIL